MGLDEFHPHVGWLLTLVPEAFAILLEGSCARGDAQRGSDIDLRVIAPSHTPRRGFARFVEHPDHGLLQVVAHVTPLSEWIEERSAPAEWAWGLPVAQEAVVLWADPDAPGEAVAPPPYQHPPRRSSLQNLVEYACKVGRAYRSSDSTSLRLFTWALAQEAAALLRQLNRRVAARHPAEALRIILAYEVAPPGYRGNMELLIGIRAAGSQTEFGHAATSLVLGTVDLLAEHLPHIDVGRPDIRADLTDGTLRRYLMQQLP